MATKDEVAQFLKQFNIKLKVFDVVYINREKNTQALLDLEISPFDRRNVLENLEVRDYSEGPLEETMHDAKTRMWVFGKEIKGTETYIKITMGLRNKPVICISFHPAEYDLNYPFKQI